MKKYNYKELFKVYKDQYNKSSSRAGTAAESPQSFAEFKMNFDAVKKEISQTKSHRLSAKQIAQKLAREDVYESSLKQAKSIRSALEKHGFEAPSLTSIRAGKVPNEFWKLVKEERSAALESGMTNKEANMYISTYIFGSK